MGKCEVHSVTALLASPCNLFLRLLVAVDAPHIGGSNRSSCPCGALQSATRPHPTLSHVSSACHCFCVTHTTERSCRACGQVYLRTIPFLNSRPWALLFSSLIGTCCLSMFQAGLAICTLGGFQQAGGQRCLVQLHPHPGSTFLPLRPPFFPPPFACPLQFAPFKGSCCKSYPWLTVFLRCKWPLLSVFAPSTW